MLPSSSSSNSDFRKSIKLHYSKPNFPDEILILILIKLPAKSLMRFRSISRSWDSIINSDSFISDRLHDQKSNGKTYFLFHHDQSREFSLVFDQKHEAFYSYPNEMPPLSCIHIHGSSNGFICFSIGWRRLFVCNPATKQLLRIPLPKHNINTPPRHLGSSFLAFGFHSGINDFKIIIFIPHDQDGVNELEREPEAEAKIYSLRQKSWRTFGMVPQGIVISVRDPTVVDGIMYGCREHVFQDEDGVWRKRDLVWSFDMGTEIFQDIKFPDEINTSTTHTSYELYTGVVGESLSLYRFADNVFEVWIADFCKPEIWKPTYRFGLDHDCPRRQLIKLGDTDELLLTTNSFGRLIFFNVGTQKWQYYSKDGSNLDCNFLGPYVENSLPLSK